MSSAEGSAAAFSWRLGGEEGSLEARHLAPRPPAAEATLYTLRIQRNEKLALTEAKALEEGAVYWLQDLEVTCSLLESKERFEPKFFSATVSSQHKGDPVYSADIDFALVAEKGSATSLQVPLLPAGVLKLTIQPLPQGLDARRMNRASSDRTLYASFGGGVAAPSVPGPLRRAGSDSAESLDRHRMQLIEDEALARALHRDLNDESDIPAQKARAIAQGAPAAGEGDEEDEFEPGRPKGAGAARNRDQTETLKAFMSVADAISGRAIRRASVEK